MINDRIGRGGLDGAPRRAPSGGNRMIWLGIAYLAGLYIFLDIVERAILEDK
jgi:hypothetical protein